MKSRRFAGFVFAFFFLVLGGFGQTAGKLIWQVNDSSQSSVPDATVTAENTSTGQKRSASTDKKGGYSIPDLPIGTYTVSVEQPGFSVAKRENVLITVAQTATVDIVLQPGTLNQVVEVQASAEAVAIQPGETIDTSQVANLPINGRDFARFAFQTPGAVARSNFI